jgi:hypothetical protein
MGRWARGTGHANAKVLIIEFSLHGWAGVAACSVGVALESRRGPEHLHLSETGLRLIIDFYSCLRGRARL